MPAHDAAADDFVSVAGGGMDGCSAGWLLPSPRTHWWCYVKGLARMSEPPVGRATVRSLKDIIDGLLTL